MQEKIKRVFRPSFGEQLYSAFLQTEASFAIAVSLRVPPEHCQDAGNCFNVPLTRLSTSLGQTNSPMMDLAAGFDSQSFRDSSCPMRLSSMALAFLQSSWTASSTATALDTTLETSQTGLVP